MLKKVIALTMLIAATVGCRQAVADDTPEFGQAVKVLNDELDRRAACFSGSTKTVGIWPIDGANLPISATNAEHLYSAILSALIAGKPDCVTVLDGDGVGKVLRYSNVVQAFRDQGNAPRERIDRNLQSVDFIVSIQIREQQGHVAAVLKLTERASGATLATTPALRVPQRYLASACGDGATTMASALASAARHLMDGAPAMTTLVDGGGYFEGSNARTDLSQHLSAQLVDEVTGLYANPLTGARLRILRPMRNDPQRIASRTRGATIRPKDLERSITLGDRTNTKDKQADEGVFTLVSRYWLCPDESRAKLSVQLVSSDGEVVNWTGPIRLDTLPEGIDKRPPRAVPAAGFGPAGGFAFTMMSPRGQNPVYRSGELFKVIMTLDQPAWLYCFYTDSAGKVFQFLPNPYVRNDPSANRFGAQTGIVFPEMFDIEINDKTTGLEQFSCYATSRNVTADLPAELRGNGPVGETGLPPLPQRLASRLAAIFSSLPDTTIASQTVSITILEGQ